MLHFRGKEALVEKFKNSCEYHLHYFPLCISRWWLFRGQVWWTNENPGVLKSSTPQGLAKAYLNLSQRRPTSGEKNGRLKIVVHYMFLDRSLPCQEVLGFLAQSLIITEASPHQWDDHISTQDLIRGKEPKIGSRVDFDGQGGAEVSNVWCYLWWRGKVCGIYLTGSCRARDVDSKDSQDWQTQTLTDAGPSDQEIELEPRFITFKELNVCLSFLLVPLLCFKDCFALLFCCHSLLTETHSWTCATRTWENIYIILYLLSCFILFHTLLSIHSFTPHYFNEACITHCYYWLSGQWLP